MAAKRVLGKALAGVLGAGLLLGAAGCVVEPAPPFASVPAYPYNAYGYPGYYPPGYYAPRYYAPGYASPGYYYYAAPVYGSVWYGGR
jgi:hypothetical protein